MGMGSGKGTYVPGLKALNIKAYLACPYSTKDNDRKLEKVRFEIANQAAAYLMAKGYIVFSPISHSHPIAMHLERFGETNTHTFWLRQDKHFIDLADELWILMLPGWKESYGVTWETGYAEAQGKPINYLSALELGGDAYALYNERIEETV